MAQEPYVTTPGTTGVPPAERSPEEIRREIGDTRSELGSTIEQIEDRVSPTRIRERQVARVRGRWYRVKDSVMGTSPVGTQSAYSSAQSGLSSAADTVRSAPEAATRQTQGNPLAAGLIAFGVGALAGSLLPTSPREQEAAQQLRDRFEEPVRREASQVGQNLKQELQGTAQQAVEETKETARDAAQQTKEHAQDSAQSVREESQSRMGNVRSSDV